jgi:predicted nucleotidyltransferase
VKRKTTVYIDDELLRAAKVRAAESGRKEYEVFEQALRDYLARQVVPTMETLRQQREHLLGIAEKHGARNVRVFGSVARGEARPDSDVDFVVELEAGRNMLDLSGLILDLQDALGRDVNVVEITAPSRAAERIQREAISL